MVGNNNLTKEDIKQGAEEFRDKKKLEDPKNPFINPLLKLGKPEKVELLLDGEGRSMTNLCEDISNILKDENILFYKHNTKQIVEVGKIKIKNENEDVFNGFIEMKDKRFVTLIERYATVGRNISQRNNMPIFETKSLSPHKSAIVLSSHILEESLPQIERIFQVPLPIIYEGKLTFPNQGYDGRFNSWLPFNSPLLEDDMMDIEKAKEIIEGLYSEFCFKSEQDKTNAIAGLLTPYLKGLMKSFNERTPVFFYVANRERAGKDYCAGITGIVYEGKQIDDNPISSGERAGNDNEELRKKITSALMMGRKRLHSANNKGYINNAVFEGIITSRYWSDRMLGGNEMVELSNELDFSLSGNIGVTYTPDLANRCRFVNLFLAIEDANSREFEKPFLHEWVLENRGLILSALYSLIRNWVDNGKPNGYIPFASFHDWADICGGIMESAGYDSPCVKDEDNISSSGDSETFDMKQLFEICYTNYPNIPIKKKEIVDLIIKEEGLFSYLDFETLKGKINFGIKLRRFIGREFSTRDGIIVKLNIVDTKVRKARQEFIFQKVEFGSSGSVGSISPIATNVKGGSVGIDGNTSPIATYGNNNIIYKGTKCTRTTNTTKTVIEEAIQEESPKISKEQKEEILKFFENNKHQINKRLVVNQCSTHLGIDIKDILKCVGGIKNETI